MRQDEHSEVLGVEDGDQADHEGVVRHGEGAHKGGQGRGRYAPRTGPGKAMPVAVGTVQPASAFAPPLWLRSRKIAAGADMSHCRGDR